jgi:hypothetical protein
MVLTPKTPSMQDNSPIFGNFIHSLMYQTHLISRQRRGLNTINGPQPPVRFYTTSHNPPYIGGSLVSEDCLNKEGISLHLLLSKKYNALTPFKQTGTDKNIIPPLYITKSLLYSMQNADRYLNKLSCDSLVKKFILKGLEQEFIITARLGSDGTNILNTVRSKETFYKKKIIEGDNPSMYYTDKSFNCIDFSSFRSNIFRLNKIHQSLHGRFNKDNGILVIDDCASYKKIHGDWCGCYVIYSEKSLYYYIGYSKDIDNRLSSHVSKIKKYHLDSYSYFKERYSLYLQSRITLFPDDTRRLERGERCLEFVGSPLDFYLISCIKNKHNFNISMGPICLYKNFLIEFTSKYPDYILSLLEHSILTYYTELIGKMMEQSLIYHYNPLLNNLKHISIKNITLGDNSLNISHTSKLKPKKIRYHVNTNDGREGLSLKSE